MREIKFRVWHKRWKVMSPPIEIWHIDDAIYELEAIAKQKGVPIDSIDSTSREDLVYMQYTGLRDRNGKEIYEGDIVKANIDGYECLAVIDYSNAFFWVRVIDAPEGSNIKRGMGVGLIGDNGIVKFVEIIGNVFEDKPIVIEP